LVTSKSTRETPPTTDDRDGVLTPAVDDPVPTPFNVRAVGGDHDRSHADAGKGEGAVGLADGAHCVGERFLTAVKGLLLSACAPAAAANTKKPASQIRRCRMVSSGEKEHYQPSH
jgi:hypothetical protein